MTDFNEVEPEGLSPIQVERRLMELTGTLSKALVDWKRLHREHKETERLYDQAFARAKLRAADEGIAANDRKCYADIDEDVMKAREAMDLASTAFGYAEKRLMAVKSAIEVWRSVNTSVREAYAGTGRF